jgi:CheY-like chemotaxis protein
VKLLVIDDNEEITEMISFFCTSIRIDCTVVNDGKEGLEVIHKNNEFDLILLDVGMPDFSGVDIVNSLKQDGVLESKNVVIMTASSDALNT